MAMLGRLEVYWDEAGVMLGSELAWTGTGYQERMRKVLQDTDYDRWLSLVFQKMVDRYKSAVHGTELLRCSGLTWLPGDEAIVRNRLS